MIQQSKHVTSRVLWQRICDRKKKTQHGFVYIISIVIVASFRPELCDHVFKKKRSISSVISIVISIYSIYFFKLYIIVTHVRNIFILLILRRKSQIVDIRIIPISHFVFGPSFSLSSLFLYSIIFTRIYII